MLGENTRNKNIGKRKGGVTMEQRRVLDNGEVVIKTEEGIYFHALDESSIPLLIGEEEGKELMGV